MVAQNNNVLRICSNGNPEELETLNLTIPSEIWINERLDGFNRTPLHIATRAGNLKNILWLLESLADARLKDSGNKTPYECCKDRTTRNIYRRFRFDCPDAFPDWKLTKIDDPLSPEDEKKQKENLKKKKPKKKSPEKEKTEEKVVKASSKGILRELKPKKSSIEIEREKRLAAIARRMNQ